MACRAADARVLVDEARSDDVFLVQASPAEEVLAFEVVGERMLRVRPRWDALQRVTAQLQLLCECAAASRARPPLGVRDDCLANLRRSTGARVPDAASGKDLARADVEVVARSVGVFGQLVPEVDPEVRLVRRLVLGEARVAVDPEQ